MNEDREMIKRLLEVVGERTAPEKTAGMQVLLSEMVCNENQPIPLSARDIVETLSRPGEFHVVTLDYEEAQREIETHRLDASLNEALTILACFEDDGRRMSQIEDFVAYLHDKLDDFQRFRFGVKRVTSLSDHPVILLFSEILPINQLRLVMHPDAMRYLMEKEEKLQPHFRRIRYALARKLGIPILPFHRVVDPELPPERILVVDPVSDKTIAQFSVESGLNDETLDIYLEKLIRLYHRLAKEQKSRIDPTQAAEALDRAR